MPRDNANGQGDLTNFWGHKTLSNFSIWVLVAGENDAVICASDAGSSRLLRVVKKESLSDDTNKSDRHGFAWQLMSELMRGVDINAYDGVIIMASQELLREIHRVAVPEVKKRVIAEIARPSSDSYAIPVGFEDYVADMPAMGGVQ